MMLRIPEGATLRRAQRGSIGLLVNPYRFVVNSATNFGLVARGNNDVSGFTDDTEKMNFASDTWSAGTSLNVGSTANEQAFGDNSTRGLFVDIGSPQTTESYAYASDTVGTAGNLNTTRDGFGAIWNATVGILAGGYSGGYLATSTKYTLSSDAVSVGGSISTAKRFGFGAGSTDRGYFFGGEAAVTPTNTTGVRKYTYSGDTTAAVTALGSARAQLACFGGLSYAIAIGGYTLGAFDTHASGWKYTFSSDAQTASSSLAADIAAAGGMSDSARGLVCGGNNDSSASQSTVSVYPFSSETVTTTAALSTARNGAEAVSASPGHL